MEWMHWKESKYNWLKLVYKIIYLIIIWTLKTWIIFENFKCIYQEECIKWYLL